MSGSTVGAVLQAAIGSGVSRLDAQLLLGHVLGRPRTWLIAHDDDTVDVVGAARFAEFAGRSAGGEPVAYLLGGKEFHGLWFDLNRDVLVPRPLVDWALELLAGPLGHVARPAVVDLGTGSGAIAVAVKHRAPRVSMLAVDASAPALEVARRNASRLDVDVDFVVGSWWDALADRRFDLVLSNPPYVAPGDPHLATLRYEPVDALVAAEAGLAALRAVIDGAANHLERGGWVIVEHGFEQADRVRGLFEGAGLVDVESRRDWNGQPRCSTARSAGA